MSDKRKCFWLELAAWGLFIVAFIFGDSISALLSSNAEKLIGILVFMPSWVLSLFALNEWSGIPEEERDEMNHRFGRFLYRLKPGYIIMVLPILLPVLVLCAVFFD